MTYIAAKTSVESRGNYPGVKSVELTRNEIQEVHGGWLPVAGLALGVAGRALGGWAGVYINRVGFGLAVFETARWIGGGGEEYGRSGSPRE